MRRKKKVSRIPQSRVQAPGLLRLVTLEGNQVECGSDCHFGKFSDDYEKSKHRHREGIWMHIFGPLKMQSITCGYTWGGKACLGEGYQGRNDLELKLKNSHKRVRGNAMLAKSWGFF